jgi:CheY-like chemotaxis protein
MGHVLVVDDIPAVRDLFADILKHAGHTSQTASDALEAAQLLERTAFDAAIIDIFMPVIDGLEIVRTWRETYPRMGLLAISGGGPLIEGKDVLALAEELGAAATLRKPVDATRLLGVLKALLTPPTEHPN